MKVAVLPLMPTQGTPAYLGRQFSNFASEQIRLATDAEVNSVSYLTQVSEEDGPKVGFINFAEMKLEQTQIKELFEQSGVDVLVEGNVTATESGFDLDVRFHHNGEDQARRTENWKVSREEVFSVLHRLIKTVSEEAEIELPETLSGDELPYGTQNSEAFLKFFEGYDAFHYVQQAQGRVVSEFSPEPAFEALEEAMRLDPDFLGPYEVLTELARACISARIGNFDMVNAVLLKAQAAEPDEFKAFFVQGELFQAVENASGASDSYDKAVNARERVHKARLEEGEVDESYNGDMAGLYGRLGIAQMQAGMPVNAERNFRKAMELEGDQPQSADMLSMVLQQTGREHEIVPLWRGILDRNPQNAEAHIKYAVTLMQTNREEEGIAAFEHALETLENNSVVKRFYAPLLANKGDLDRAMDFFEDALDESPTDVQLLMQYAETLKMADRNFEIPKVLRDVLNCNPDQDTRANTLAWLIELEQPKRAETVDSARDKMEAGDFEGAVRELKPLKNWLADYWKMWALLSSAHNKLDQPEEAEDAARRLLELFPGCEPGYGELNAALGAQGKNEEAYNVMAYAFRGNPKSLGIFINLGLAAKRAGKDDEARSIAKQVREALGPGEQVDELEPVLAEIEK
ncbi:MAG: tetratricopeptide repeat protein [Chlorobia bacterium]|nr:tetratricopeptide repeat protein [Fimbriimonadaceae bacterium]